MNENTPLFNLLNKLERVERKGDRWVADCPNCVDNGKNPNLSIKVGGDGKVLIHCFAGCDPGDVLARVGLKWADLYPDSGKHATPQADKPKLFGNPKDWPVTARYDYVDALGRVLYQVRRKEPKGYEGRGEKTFLPFIPKGDGWACELPKNWPRVPYRLPQLLHSFPGEWVYVVEGEKSADALATLGVAVTTSQGGADQADQWKGWTEFFEGRRVCILPDQDEPGRRKFADRVAFYLSPVTSDLRILDLPGLAHKQDPFDWIALGNGRDELADLTEHAPEYSPLPVLTADAILATEWPEPVWAIPDLLPVGLAILAGKPKVGKSWLGLQVCFSVASGGMALNQKVDAGPILYLALEDTPRRLQERMRKQNWTRGLPADFMPLGQFFDQVGDLRNGGGERLARQIERRGYRLVVIDTLSRAIVGDQNDVAEMTRALTPLQEMAHAQNCAVVLVDHHRKGMGFDADAITDILGSTAKGAMADTCWGLYRERGKAGAKLAITGRDVNEQNLALEMDWITGCWQCVGDADELAITERRQEILDVIESLGAASNAAIARAIGQDRSNTYRRLQDMVGVGLIVKDVDDKYTLNE
jgi:hypothetical protein